MRLGFGSVGQIIHQKLIFSILVSYETMPYSKPTQHFMQFAQNSHHRWFPHLRNNHCYCVFRQIICFSFDQWKRGGHTQSIYKLLTTLFRIECVCENFMHSCEGRLKRLDYKRIFCHIVLTSFYCHVGVLWIPNLTVNVMLILLLHFDFSVGLISEQTSRYKNVLTI